MRLRRLRNQEKKKYAIILGTVVVLLAGSFYGTWLVQRQAYPLPHFFATILQQAPTYYREQFAVLQAQPVASDMQAGCIDTYHGYPPDEPSPSKAHPYDCLIHVSKNLSAPQDKVTAAQAIQKFAALAQREGFVKDVKLSSAPGDGSSADTYDGDTYFGGKIQCHVTITYFPATPASPGSYDAAPATYLYELNCGAMTYPYTPPGYPIGKLPQAGQ